MSVDPRVHAGYDPNDDTGRQVPMGAHPPEAPRLDEVIVAAFYAVEPSYADHPESAVESADPDVDDSIGAE